MPCPDWKKGNQEEFKAFKVWARLCHPGAPSAPQQTENMEQKWPEGAAASATEVLSLNSITEMNNDVSTAVLISKVQTTDAAISTGSV